MRTVSTTATKFLFRGGSALALAIALSQGNVAFAQDGTQPDDTPAEEAGVGESGNENEIVVTGSRIERAGFEQPTPTMVLGNTEIRQSAKQNLQQVLNEQPQVRNTVSPTGTIANTSTGTAPVDLRGLGIDRTLTLINGRRFVGSNNLNFVPVNLVERIEVVTGGASAAWGSDAVAGVVNIILNNKLEGFSLGANSGISSRGDGFRYGFEGSFGTNFAGGRGHFMIGAEYVRDKGIGVRGRQERPWLGASLVEIDTDANGQPIFELQPDVNDFPVTFGGISLFGSTAGQVFDPDGSLRPFESRDAMSLFDTLLVQSPLERLGSYARLSYDIGGGATVWVDAAYGRSKVNQPFLADPASEVLVTFLSPDNPFLNPQIRQQLADAGDPFFVLGRFSRDTFLIQYDAERETKEVAIGVDGTFGSGWKYNAHFSHGEVDIKERFFNSSIPDKFLRAIDAVQTPGGIVCGVNANANPADDDPACVPFNPFGEGASSEAARNYVRGTQSMDTVNKLDSAAVKIQGDPFSLWAGPVTIAVGAEARWQEQTSQNGELDRESRLDENGLPISIFGTPLFRDALNGRTNVKEAFAEALVPLLDVDQVKIELNGAARYSDYSRSGGIWSWKVGGTARLFDSLLLRATRSRDIRAPNIGELFSINNLNIRDVVDQDTEGRIGIPGYNPNPSVSIFSGGNPDLVPEVSKTWTIGGSFSPSFLQGFNLSVDYYDIKISGAIELLQAEDVTAACAAGVVESCDLVTRDPATQTIISLRTTYQNIASFETSGFDIEASYILPMSRISNLPGTLRFRALATYVDKLVFETPFNIRSTAGSVGDGVDGTPKWRANFSATYQSDTYGLDLRLRYVGGGKFDKDLNIVNNDIGARTYVDLGAQFKVADKFTFFGNVNNVFDVDPPLITQTTSTHYDGIGRYFTFGARVDF